MPSLWLLMRKTHLVWMFFDSPITEEEIMRAVEHLKVNKAPGTDGILVEMIKTSLPQI